MGRSSISTCNGLPPIRGERASYDDPAHDASALVGASRQPLQSVRDQPTASSPLRRRGFYDGLKHGQELLAETPLYFAVAESHPCSLMCAHPPSGRGRLARSPTPREHPSPSTGTDWAAVPVSVGRKADGEWRVGRPRSCTASCRKGHDYDPTARPEAGLVTWRPPGLATESGGHRTRARNPKRAHPRFLLAKGAIGVGPWDSTRNLGTNRSTLRNTWPNVWVDAVMREVRDIVAFDHPPVVEVVCGAQFSPLPLKTAHFGLFWAKVRDRYPHVDDAPPLGPVIEAPPNEAPQLAVLEFSALPDLRRVHFKSRDGATLVQLQHNRLHQNWRRQRERDQYPRFKEILPAFLSFWDEFKRFLAESSLPEPELTQYELSYVNHVPEGALWNPEAGVERLFPWVHPKNEALPGAPDLELALRYLAPTCNGRLHFTARTGLRVSDKTRVLVLELTVRGAPRDQATGEDLDEWLLAAREIVVRSFASLTSDEAHKTWGRTQ